MLAQFPSVLLSVSVSLSVSGVSVSAISPQRASFCDLTQLSRPPVREAVGVNHPRPAATNALVRRLQLTGEQFSARHPCLSTASILSPSLYRRLALLMFPTQSLPPYTRNTKIDIQQHIFDSRFYLFSDCVLSVSAVRVTSSCSEFDYDFSERVLSDSSVVEVLFPSSSAIFFFVVRLVLRFY